MSTKQTLYTAIYDGVEFEVKFDGCNRQMDQDLIYCDRLPQKRPPTERKFIPADDSPNATATILEALQDGTWTRTELMRLTGLSRTSVNGALRQFASQGILAVSTHLEGNNHFKRYGLREAA